MAPRQDLKAGSATLQGHTPGTDELLPNKEEVNPTPYEKVIE